MKTLTNLANEILDEIFLIDNVNNFVREPLYQANTMLRVIKSSNSISSKYSFDWDQIRLFQDTLDLLEDGPPTLTRYQMFLYVLNKEDATS